MADTLAVVIERPGTVDVRRLTLIAPGPADLVVEVGHSAISTGTERLLWTGRMPAFPGLGYPLVPGYETVGRVVAAGPEAAALIGRDVFVPGASCYREARGLFGGSARRIVVPAARALPLDIPASADATLLALAATAQHALGDGPLPDLIVGHGVLGRLIARLAVARGGSPLVWEVRDDRRSGASGYRVAEPGTPVEGGCRRIIDASGAPDLLDLLVPHLAHRGEILLAGFYDQPLSFAFPPAFRREARIAIAAEFTPADLAAVHALSASGALLLSGLVSHVAPAGDAPHAYHRAFDDPECLKLALDWRHA